MEPFNVGGLCASLVHVLSYKLFTALCWHASNQKADVFQCYLVLLPEVSSKVRVGFLQMLNDKRVMFDCRDRFFGHNPMDYDSLALAGFDMNIAMIFEIFLVEPLGLSEGSNPTCHQTL
jgi:hypothetical protein